MHVETDPRLGQRSTDSDVVFLLHRGYRKHKWDDDSLQLSRDGCGNEDQLGGFGSYKPEKPVGGRGFASKGWGRIQ